MVLLGRKVMTNLDIMFKSRDITLLARRPPCCMERQGSLVQCLHFTEVRTKASGLQAKARMEQNTWGT